jgi:hypothetical protein
MTGDTRRFLAENRLQLSEGRLLGVGSILLDKNELRYIHDIISNCTQPHDVWNPIGDWDNIDESHQKYWQALVTRLGRGASFKTVDVEKDCFKLCDPSNGPVDNQNNPFVIELTSTLIEDILRELDQTGPDGIIPVQGFKS